MEEVQKRFAHINISQKEGPNFHQTEVRIQHGQCEARQPHDIVKPAKRPIMKHPNILFNHGYIKEGHQSYHESRSNVLPLPHFGEVPGHLCLPDWFFDIFLRSPISGGLVLEMHFGAIPNPLLILLGPAPVKWPMSIIQTPP
jgi:hypothetical protein